MSGKDPFCCSGGSQQGWVLQVPGVLAVSHPVGSAHHPSLLGCQGACASLGTALGRIKVPLLVLAPTKDMPAPVGAILASSGLGRSGSAWHRVMGLAHMPGIFQTPSCPQGGKNKARI